MVGITSRSSFKKLDFRFSDVAGKGSVWGGCMGWSQGGNFGVVEMRAGDVGSGRNFH